MEPIALLAYVREDHDRWLELAADPPMAASCVNRAAARMLEQCRIPHVLHVSVAELDGSCRLRYRIAHRQPLSDAVGGASWHAGRAMRLLFKLCEALENSTQYLLKPDGFVLRPEYIFVGVDDDDLGLVYVPISAVDGRKEARLAFAELCDWLAAQPGNKQDGRLQAIAGWSREPTWSISLMKKRIGRTWMGEEGTDAGRIAGGDTSEFAAAAMASGSGLGSGAGLGRSRVADVATGALKSTGEGTAMAASGLPDKMKGPAAAVRAAIRSLPPAVWLVAAVALALAGWRLDRLPLAAGGAATAMAAWASSAWLRRRTARTGPGEQAGGREVPPQLARDTPSGAGAAASHAPAAGWSERGEPLPPPDGWDGWGAQPSVDGQELPDGWSAAQAADGREPQREPVTAAAPAGLWPSQPPSTREAASPAHRFGIAAEPPAPVASAATTPLPSSSADATVWLGAGRGKGTTAPDSYHGIVQIRKGDERQRLPWIGEPRFVLGRGPDGVHYRDDSLGVSRQHIELVREGDSICARDLDSVNGTLLNGEWMEPQRAYPLKDGDVLQMLRTEIIYRR